MYDDDVTGRIAMGVGVFFGGPAVSGPARVAYAVGALGRVEADSFFEVAELAGRPPHRQFIAVGPYRQPAESYPRYSSLLRLSMMTGTASPGPI